MTTADIIIVLIIVLALALIIGLSLFKRRKSPCSHCPYKKSCDDKACGAKLGKNKDDKLA